MTKVSAGALVQWKKMGPPMVWREVPLHDQLESILNGIFLFGALALTLMANLSSVNDVLSSNRRPICSEFQAPFTSQLLPSGVLLHCFESLMSTISSRIWSRIATTCSISIDLLFVMALEFAAGRSSYVLFMTVFDKSLSVVLLNEVVEAGWSRGVVDAGGREMFAVKNKTINFRFS